MSRSHPDNLPEPSSQRPVGCRGGLFQADLKAHLDGEMSPVRNWLVRWHLAQCAECREEFRWLRRLGEDMKDIESARPRPELRARILANLPSTPPAPGIRVVHSRPERENAPRLMPRLALAGALALVLTFSAVFALKHSSDAGSGPTGAIALGNKRPPKSLPDAPADQNSSDKMKAILYKPADKEPDPYSKLADAMFHKEMTDMAREKQLQGQDDLHRLMTQARAIAQKTDSPANTEMGITLTVADIAVVRAHLPSWAKQQGAELVTNGSPTSGTSESTPNRLPARLDVSSDGVVAFYVPAERGPAFLGALKKLGQISMLPPAMNAMTASAQPPKITTPAEPNPGDLRKAVPGAPLSAEANAPGEKAPVAHEKPNKATRYLVLTVLLQAAVHTHP